MPDTTSAGPEPGSIGELVAKLAAMGEAIKSTVWFTGGCKSWYFDSSGRPNLYPWFPLRYLQEMRRPEFSEYHLIK